MNSGRSVFAQLLDHVPMHEFRKCVARYAGNHRVRSFSCWDHFLCLTFAQLTYRESLRDIVACLRAGDRRLYHMGIRGTVSRSTLADANESRDWRIYAEFAQVLIQEARCLYADDPFGLELAHSVYAFDSTTIDLCMSLFPWAHHTRRQHAIKLHTLLDLRGNIPTFLRITPARVHDVNVLDDLVLEAGAFYILDRGYVDFGRLYRFTEQQAFFVTRAKKNLRRQRLVSHPVDKTTGVLCDQRISLVCFYPSHAYPVPLRRIRYRDPTTDKRLVFLTNNFALPPVVIAKLYRCRWQVELFFKWIKQHLRIKAFYGTSENAVKTQIWVAVCAYLLVAIARKRLGLDLNLYTILQVLSLSLFEKMPINEVLSTARTQEPGIDDGKQLTLWHF